MDVTPGTTYAERVVTVWKGIIEILPLSAGFNSAEGVQGCDYGTTSCWRRVICVWRKTQESVTIPLC